MLVLQGAEELLDNVVGLGTLRSGADVPKQRVLAVFGAVLAGEFLDEHLPSEAGPVVRHFCQIRNCTVASANAGFSSWISALPPPDQASAAAGLARYPVLHRRLAGVDEPGCATG